LEQNLKNGLRDSDHDHYRVGCHPKISTWYILPANEIWRVAAAVLEIWLRVWNLKWVIWPWPHPF